MRICMKDLSNEANENEWFILQQNIHTYEKDESPVSDRFGMETRKMEKGRQIRRLL